MPVSGLIALLDDIASISDSVAAMAAATAKKGTVVADDVASLTGVAAKKTAGVVTDDMAVTAEQAIGIRREREIPVVVAVAKGSLINKALYLTPGALVLNAVAPWSIVPILMAGGLFLSFEGVEKVLEKLHPHDGADEDDGLDAATDPEAFERSRVSGAIRTDFILSGEIIAISLGEVAQAPFLTQVGTLYAVSVIMTIGVYGIVGVLIKMDDAGEWLATQGGARKTVGELILAAAPKVLHAISQIGTFAMLMVGGHILLEGILPLEQVVHHLLDAIPVGRGAVGMVIDVLIGAIAGLGVVGVFATGIPSRLKALFKRG